jgi:ABC-type Mn2+/Zn2+ transport system permease subunit
VATAYILGAAVAVLALSKSPRGEAETLGVFFGNILTLTSLEVWEAGGLFLATAGGLFLWRHRWVWAAVDPVAAEVGRVNVKLWNFIFQLLFAVAITLSIHMFGVLLSFAYLVLPATAGLLVVRQARALFVVAAGIALVTTVVGFELSFRGDFPTGPFIAASLAVVTGGAWVWSLARRI